MPSVMTLRLPAASTPAAAAPATGWRQRLRAAWQRIGAADPADGLTEQTLRDIGLTRAEMSSYEAEVAGRVEATRVRAILQRQAGG
ncbi:MAG: hypothetical protein KIS83_01270 [Rubrivivax sp.]|nr:hypothetical protein [Rubrivivax sp.]